MTYPQATSYSQLSLPYLRVFVGLVLILLNLYATISFLSQGFDGLAFLGIVAFCFSIEIVKVLFSGDIGFYLALKQPEKALFSFAIVAVLFFLAIGSETWFLMNGSLKDSAQLETATARSATLQNQITAKQAQLASCHSSHLTKCVNPRTAELQALQSQLDKAMQIESEHSAALANQKFWQQISTATGASVENLQLGQNLLRSILAELMGLYLLAQFSTWKRLQNLSAQGLQSYNALREVPSNQDNSAALLAEIENLKLELAKKP